MTGITDHLGEIRARMAQAASRAAATGGHTGPVTLVAVSKGHPVAAVREGLAAGLGHFGEALSRAAEDRIGRILSVDAAFSGRYAGE